MLKKLNLDLMSKFFCINPVFNFNKILNLAFFFIEFKINY